MMEKKKKGSREGAFRRPPGDARALHNHLRTQECIGALWDSRIATRARQASYSVFSLFEGIWQTIVAFWSEMLQLGLAETIHTTGLSADKSDGVDNYLGFGVSCLPTRMWTLLCWQYRRHSGVIAFCRLKISSFFMRGILKRLDAIVGVVLIVESLAVVIIFSYEITLMGRMRRSL